jgi:WD40 repeat protein
MLMDGYEVVSTQHAEAIKHVVYWPKLEDGQLPNQNPTLRPIRLFRGRDMTTAVWDPATGAERKRLRGHDSDVAGVIFRPDGRLLGGADPRSDGAAVAV